MLNISKKEMSLVSTLWSKKVFIHFKAICGWSSLNYDVTIIGCAHVHSELQRISSWATHFELNTGVLIHNHESQRCDFVALLTFVSSLYFVDLTHPYHMQWHMFFIVSGCCVIQKHHVWLAYHRAAGDDTICDIESQHGLNIQSGWAVSQYWATVNADQWSQLRDIGSVWCPIAVQLAWTLCVISRSVAWLDLTFSFTRRVTSLFLMSLHSQVVSVSTCGVCVSTCAAMYCGVTVYRFIYATGGVGFYMWCVSTCAEMCCCVTVYRLLYVHMLQVV